MISSAPRTSSGTGRVGLALTALLTATFMGQVDMFIVTVALPSIQQDLQAGFGEAQLVVDSYIVACAAGLILSGRLGDRYGRRRVFLWGLGLFTVGSLLCGLATGPTDLIVYRFLQGAGQAVMIPQVLAIIRVTVADEERRRRALGMYGTAIGLGVIAGLAGGGLLVHLDLAGTGWRAVFLVNVPIGIAVFAAGWWSIVESRVQRPTDLDPGGSLLVAIGVTALLGVLILAPTEGASVAVLACGVVALAVAALLPAQQRRLDRAGGDPVFPPAVLVRPGFRLTMATMVVFFSGNSGLFLAFTYYLQDGLGIGPLETGLLFVPLGVTFALGSMSGPRLAARFGLRVPVAGSAVLTAGLLLLAATPALADAARTPALAIGIGICGLGQGLVVAPLVAGLLSRVQPDEAGAASGIASTATQLGFALGVAVLGSTYRALLGPVDGPGGHSGAFTATMLLITCCAVASSVLNERLRRLVT